VEYGRQEKRKGRKKESEECETAKLIDRQRRGGKGKVNERNKYFEKVGQ